MNISRIGGIAAVTLCSAALLVGCGSFSSSSDTSAATAAVDTTAADRDLGGMVECDQASIQAAVAATGTEGDPATLTQADSFKCADGWAYAYANAGTGNEQFTETLVFEAEGQFWIPKNREKVCIAPGNQVPKSIYQDACGTN